MNAKLHTSFLNTKETFTKTVGSSITVATDHSETLLNALKTYFRNRHLTMRNEKVIFGQKVVFV